MDNVRWKWGIKIEIDVRVAICWELTQVIEIEFGKSQFRRS